jgi:hypothetical protein
MFDITVTHTDPNETYTYFMSWNLITFEFQMNKNLHGHISYGLQREQIGLNNIKEDLLLSATSV